jgi:hypothetical protein
MAFILSNMIEVNGFAVDSGDGIWVHCDSKLPPRNVPIGIIVDFHIDQNTNYRFIYFENEFYDLVGKWIDVDNKPKCQYTRDASPTKKLNDEQRRCFTGMLSVYSETGADIWYYASNEEELIKNVSMKVPEDKRNFPMLVEDTDEKSVIVITPIEIFRYD